MAGMSTISDILTPRPTRPLVNGEIISRWKQIEDGEAESRELMWVWRSWWGRWRQEVRVLE